MFCENCGNKIQDGYKFCTKCGHASASPSFIQKMNPTPVVTNEKWWHRLLRVIYFFLYLQILWIVPVVWSSSSTSYTGYYGGVYHYEDTYGTAFWNSILAIVIFVVVLRLLKLIVIYILIGRKPQWSKEFKKLF